MMSASQRPPRTDRSIGSEIRVGIFVLVGVFGTLFTLFLLTDPATFRGRYRIETAVDQAGGIRAGDPVQMRGVNIGRVRGFTLDGEGVRIQLEIEGEWSISEDATTRLISNGLLGGRTVDVLQGESPRRAGRGTVLPGSFVPSALESADSFTDDVSDLLRRANRLLSDSTLVSVERGAGELDAVLRELSGLVVRQRAEVEELIASLGRTAAQVEETTAGLAPGVIDLTGRAGAALGRIEATSAEIEATSRALGGIVARIERGEGSLGLLVKDEELYRSLLSTSRSLDQLVGEIRENPTRFLKLSIF